MRKVIVSYMMVENETGGFTTGIGVKGEFTEQEFNNGKHKELIKDIPLIDGCYWTYHLKWI